MKPPKQASRINSSKIRQDSINTSEIQILEDLDIKVNLVKNKEEDKKEKDDPLLEEIYSIYK